uniref:Moesin/ezrin/radixin homolog 1 n=1 Tax=Anopheles melas TaxID=34690 RepID=A0A182UC79_9DIPT
MSLDSMGPSAGGGSSGVGTLSGTRMIHSLSTPSGVDGTVSTSHSRGGKKLAVRIQMLDDSVTMFQVQAKATGKVLFEQVCRQLNLLEADYFGLEYQEAPSGTKYWLDLEKSLNRQVGLSLVEPVLRFCVKFYTPDPLQLEEEYTRYLFCLQVKRDLATGSLQCNDNTAALMASYIVQASCGDYAAEDYPDHTYLSSYRFVPQQDHTMQRRIMENHKKHVGQSPAEADLNLLETARRCELYGMKMHPAKDHDGVPLNLAVAHMGIAVFQGITRINTFSWAKIRKISFKRKRFLIKLHPENYVYHKDTVEFFFEGRNECKNFWKKCVENHGFFRCTAVQNVQRRKARVLSRAEWERRSQSNVLRTPSQTRRQVDMEVDRLPSSPTGHSRSQLTEAQVETYPMKSYTQQMGMEGSGHTPLQDSSQSASPGGTWSSPYHNSNSNSSHAREADRARARQDGHSSVSTGTDLSDEAPDNVIYSDINDLYRHRKSTTSGGSGGGGGSASEARTNAAADEEAAEEVEDDDEIMDEVEDENAIRRPYLEDDDDDDDEIDIRNYNSHTNISTNVSKLNDSSGGTLNSASAGEMYNRSAHFDEYCGNNRYSDTSDYFSHSQQHYSHSPNSQSLATTITHKNGLTDDDDRYSCSNPPPIHPRTSHSLPRNSQLAKIESIDSNYSGGEGGPSSGGRTGGSSGEHNFMGHHSLNNLPSSSKVTNDYLHYSSLLKGGGAGDGGPDDPMNSKKTSSERLEYELSNANIYSTVQYKNYEEDFDEEEYMNYQRQRGADRDASKEAWLRSSSCKELCDYGYDSTGRADFSLMEREFLTSDRIDSPVTRYDDSRHSMYVQKSNYSVEVSQDCLANEGKVYSSSYPGTTYNTIDHTSYRKHTNQNFYSNYEYGSQDDISHDSYELLEKSDDELYYKFKADSEAHTRSCSLDSGNYIPTDDESIPDQQQSGHHSHHVSRLSRYCSSLETKSKSAPDIDDLDDMFLMEDPRDLPREKLCVKSDGNFYKKIKMAMGGSSRMSSPESRSDYYESKLSKSSGSSKKSKDSVYHTDSNKKSRETLKSKSGSGFNSRASSQDSKDAFGGMDILLTKNYEMPTTTSKKAKYLSKRFDSSSRNSSQDSKSDYYDASEQQ